MVPRSPNDILRFICAQGGDVDDYPIIEFYGAVHVVDDLVNEGLLNRTAISGGWNRYQITEAGVGRLESIGVISRTETPKQK